MKFFAAILFITSVIFTGCTEKKASTISEIEKTLYGQWDTDKQYSNDFFRITLTVPDDWHLEKESNDQLTESGTTFLSGGDANFEAQLKAAEKKNHTVFLAFRHPYGTPGKSNPNVTMFITDVTHLIGVKSAADYLLLVEDSMKLGQPNILFPNAPTPVNVGGSEFWMREIQMPIGQRIISQKYYAKLEDRYVLVFVATTMSNEDIKTVNALTSSIRKK